MIIIDRTIEYRFKIDINRIEQIWTKLKIEINFS